ncbi:MAG: flavodoxin family protein [Clostridiales bacterium]|nr:flavodoxin family protein [Clostridiales bacterium]
MKVLGLCSGRKNGNTEIMMKELFMAVEEKIPGAECKLVRVQETEINTCVGCETCMVNHLKGNWDFRCIHKNGSDHFYFIEQLMREADAIVVSSPAYNLLPTGQLIKLLNKMHASGDYRDVVEKENKIGAAFSIGGTDWTNFTLNVCKMMAMELAGSYEALVDAVHFDFMPSKGAVLLEDDVLARMRKMGENIADALLKKEQSEKPEYVGIPGVCPDCHGNLLEIREDGVYCPQCLTKANVSVVDGKLTAEFTQEERDKNRWSIWGKRLHDDNIRKGHAKAAQGKDVIREKSKKYIEYERAVKLPDPVR